MIDTVCAECGEELNYCESMGARKEPEPGDYTVCGECRAFLVFTDTMDTRLMGEEEVAELPADERRMMVALREALREMDEQESAVKDLNGAVEDYEDAVSMVCGYISAHGFYDANINDVGMSKIDAARLVEKLLKHPIVYRLVCDFNEDMRRATLSRAIEVARETAGAKTRIIQALQAMIDE